MPFDGIDLPVFDILDAPIPAKSRAAGWLLRLRSLWARKPDSVETLVERRLAVVQLLEDANALISDPDAWGQGAYWRFPNHRCAMGALRFAARRLDDIAVPRSAHAVLALVARSRGYTSVEWMNDRSSHSEVLQAFDEAIALARAGVP
ncbi:MAG TPA: hypothetical protein VMF86_11410 [Stellaceae bacterium]|nr:hypothetical protein [Stellaceae bacterium]